MVTTTDPGFSFPFCTGRFPCSPGCHDLHRCLQKQQAGGPQTRNSGNEKSSLIPIRSGCALSSSGSNSSRGEDPEFLCGQVSVRIEKTQAWGDETYPTRWASGGLWFSRNNMCSNLSCQKDPFILPVCMRSKSLMGGWPQGEVGLLSCWHQVLAFLRSRNWLQVLHKVIGVQWADSLTDLTSVYGGSVMCQVLGWALETPKRTRHVWALYSLTLPCNSDLLSDKSWL